MGRLSNSARKSTRVATLIAAALLDEGEVVETLVAGRLGGNGAVLVLTDRQLLLVDDRGAQVERFGCSMHCRCRLGG
ncbi:MAG: hypothetical protein R2701_06985 [Acidimicrobiales bacterium]